MNKKQKKCQLNFIIDFPEEMIRHILYLGALDNMKNLSGYFQNTSLVCKKFCSVIQKLQNTPYFQLHRQLLDAASSKNFKTFNDLFFNNQIVINGCRTPQEKLRICNE